MVFVLILFTIYNRKIIHKQRFEVIILVCMFLVFPLNAIAEIKVFMKRIKQNEALYISFLTIYKTVGPILHWIYASQYMKTCFLISGMVQKARLLFERHRTVIESEY